MKPHDWAMIVRLAILAVGTCAPFLFTKYRAASVGGRFHFA
jgi:hypothetical protein